MSKTLLLILIYGVFMFVGALFGAKAGSKVSLIAGTISSLLILIGVAIAAKNPIAGYVTLSAITGLLCVTFVIRLIKTQTFMPAGMLLIVTLIAFAISIMQVIKLKG